ncbi:phosphotransferase family protein [Ligilactobacillus sp. Marseille-Q7487]|jgi:thiamine kinase-like enzyme|uniref:phosphotransferase family protein n=1 Tax=Ligilactobacillus sp. Marseille-Q7487 TaxID=3022128 RepID=UPI0015B3E381|nr:phosphotransferase family protein [Ligilactobacillus sp. Marseille-Q7487]
MDFDFENGWQILPIGGETGAAYMGINKDEKVFLKRNTSPFLAALSLEKITPRLIWSKRMNTGETLTAQEWLNGRCLTRQEMTSPQVAALLYRVHHSQLLKKMLYQVGGQIVTPSEVLNRYFRGLPSSLRQHPLLKDVANRLRASQPSVLRSEYEVCHGDLNHKNWLLSETNKLYLVDWESAIIADPAMDISMLMCQYVPRVDWEQWLREYFTNDQLTQQMRFRVEWYAMANLLLAIKKSNQRGRFNEMNQDILKLSEIIKQQKFL